MLGLMQDWPLTLDRIIVHAERTHPWRTVTTRSVEGDLRRTTYGEIAGDARRGAALAKRGVRLGDRVGTLAWNTDRHLALWYGICGIGAVYHTLNPRLFPQQIAWIADHGGDRLIFADLTFVPLLESIQDRMPLVTDFVVMTDEAHMPARTSLRCAISFERFLAVGDRAGEAPIWGGFDENTAAGLCYTSGTTGDPKGVLYSHRSNMLMSLVAANALKVHDEEVVLPVVPMFHANAWTLNFVCPMVGARMVLPGPKLDGASLHGLIEAEGVTWAAAVPTVWLSLLQHMEEHALKLTTLRRVLVGGASTPPGLARAFAERHGVEVTPVWGMTETSPLGTVGGVVPEGVDLGPEERLAARLRQGRNAFGVEMRLADNDGCEVPRDGRSMGRLTVRGPAVAKAYYRAEAPTVDEAGWFDTGDIATIDAWNAMHIADRAKDVIKSGGEWISSVEIENLAAEHPAAAVCAVVGVPHEKWDERPLLIVQLRPGTKATAEDFLSLLDGRIVRWWMPDAVVFVDAVPLGATGKVDKAGLRRRFAAASATSNPTTADDGTDVASAQVLA